MAELHEVPHDFGAISAGEAASFSMRDLFKGAMFPQGARISSALIQNASASDVVVQPVGVTVLKGRTKEVNLEGALAVTVKADANGPGISAGFLTADIFIRGCACG